MGKREGRNHLEDPDVDRRIILRWIFRKWMEGGEGAWTGLIWLRIGTGGGRQVTLRCGVIMYCYVNWATSDHAL